MKSCLMLSIHVHFDLTFLLPPGTSITITFLSAYSSSFFITLLPTFVHFARYFSHFHCPLFFPYSVMLCDSTHPSQHLHFRQSHKCIKCHFVGYVECSSFLFWFYLLSMLPCRQLFSYSFILISVGLISREFIYLCRCGFILLQYL